MCPILPSLFKKKSVLTMNGQLMEIELKKIRPNRLNPRLEINVIRLNNLADSIKQVGLLEPLIVRPIDDGYEVVVGERRYRASQQAGLKTVPVVVRQYTDDEVLELNLVENIQREDLSAVEKGNCCKQLLDKYPKKFGKIQTLSNRLGVSSATVKTWLKLTEAPREIQKMVAPAHVERQGTPEGKIDYTTAATIMRRIPETEKQIELSQKLASEGMSQKLARQVIDEASKSPEKNIEEILTLVKEEPIELVFKPSDIKSILDGTKTQIVSRGAPNQKIKIGVTVQAIVYMPHFADLQIVSVERKRLRYFDEEDAKKEGYSSLTDFKCAWKKEHGEYNDEELVHIIHFERIK
jgi:ParB family chromosome partitioning protein